MSNNEEQRYIMKLSEGSRLAFERLFLSWYPKLESFVNKVTGDPDLAADIAQDVFLDIWKDREKISKVNHFSSYLFQMARFKLYNYFDHLSVYKKAESENISSDDHVDVEQKIFASQLKEFVVCAVNRMPDRRRKIFLMSRIGGLSNDAIAKKFGISKRTVENHITNALSTIKTMINSVKFLCVVLLMNYL